MLELKIQVLGSGSMWSDSNSASYLVDDTILVDVPNGTCKNLLRQHLNLTKISNVLITHFHGDHYFDIPFFILLKAKAEDNTLNIYCDKSGKKKIKNLYKMAFPHSSKRIFKEININFENSDFFEIKEKYKIERVLVDHGTFKPAYGYIIKVGKKKIGFTGDTTLCDSLEYMMKECDYLFGDCMLIKGTSKHMGVDMLIKVIDKYPNCHYIVSHLDPETKSYLKTHHFKNIIIPNDNDIFDL